MPSRKLTGSDALLASGVASVIVPAVSVELRPPPLGCAGDCSSVSPLTVMEHGGVPAAAQVVAS
jgi:hypothetical protein